jgi:hypothetical protein
MQQRTQLLNLAELNLNLNQDSSCARMDCFLGRRVVSGFACTQSINRAGFILWLPVSAWIVGLDVLVSMGCGFSEGIEMNEIWRRTVYLVVIAMRNTGGGNGLPRHNSNSRFDCKFTAI